MINFDCLFAKTINEPSYAVTLNRGITRNSAVADKPRDAFEQTIGVAKIKNWGGQKWMSEVDDQ